MHVDSVTNPDIRRLPRRCEARASSLKYIHIVTQTENLEKDDTELDG